MILFQKKFIPFFLYVSVTFLSAFCIRQTKSEEMIDFSKLLPQKTIEMDIDKQAQVEFNSVPDKKNQIKNTEIKVSPTLVSILSPSFESNTLIVPPNTKFILSLSAYCLKSSGAGPQREEPYRVIRVDERNEIRKLINSMWGQCNSRSEVQSLAWNITNRVPHNALPSSQKQMLGLSGLFKVVEDIPLVGFGTKIISAPISLAQNVFVYTLENFASIESEIMNRKSTHQMPVKPEPSRHGPFLIEVLKTNSFSGVIVSVYNYTAEPAKFQTYEFQLMPERKDVQPLAIELSRTLACNYKKTTPIIQR
ncbi:hypothetical protein [Leptospira alstonii]|uniref:hypothetical protein n=1 Tax=Leptospira alstonii TaxID=28452 RepID=UPI000AE5F680|nr:hypothetical protein [Leptospira alstonii]